MPLGPCTSRRRLKLLHLLAPPHRTQRSGSGSQRPPPAVRSDPCRDRAGLDTRPRPRYIYRLAERTPGPRLTGGVVQQPAGTVTLRSAEGEALIAQVHRSNVAPAAAGMGEQIIRLYFWLVLALQEATLSVKRLRNLVFGAQPQPQEPPASEASTMSIAALGEGEGRHDSTPGAEAAGHATAPGEAAGAVAPQPPGGPRAGTGRLGADA